MQKRFSLQKNFDNLLDFAVIPGFTNIGFRLRQFHDLPLLEDKTIVITGANSGIGKATAQLVFTRGATVHMVVRNDKKGQDAKEQILQTPGIDRRSKEADRIIIQQCDLSSLAQIRLFAATLLDTVEKIDVLIHNAGVLLPKRTLTDDGIELTFATNVAAPFLLTRLLFPLLVKARPSRVITVSSGGMYSAKIHPEDPQLKEKQFDGKTFYAHTKRVEVALTEYCAERIPANQVSFHSMHPGWVDTPGLKRSLPTFYRLVTPFLRSAEQGADTIAWLAGSNEAKKQSGEFWHDRKQRAKYRLPKTRETSAERHLFYCYCKELTAA